MLRTAYVQLSPALSLVRSVSYDRALLAATVQMRVDGGKPVKGRIERQVPFRFGTESLDVGMDCVSPVCNDYEERGLFPFNGSIESVTLDLLPARQPNGMERLATATKMD